MPRQRLAKAVQTAFLSNGQLRDARFVADPQLEAWQRQAEVRHGFHGRSLRGGICKWLI